MAYCCNIQNQSPGEFAKFIGKQLCQSLFFEKVTGGRPMKKRLQHSVLKNTSGRLLWKLRGFFHTFLTVLCTHCKKKSDFPRKVYFSNNWALFAVHVWFLYREAKTYWWVLKQDETAIILTSIHGSVSIAKIRLFTLFF